MDCISERLPDISVDIWNHLEHLNLPILIYGMGNGADRLLERLNASGLMPQGIFASDEFVRGQLFGIYKVARYEELAERFPNATVLLAFGSRLTSVIDNIKRIAAGAPLLVPDLPIADNEYFDATFYKEHRSELEEVLGLLADGMSRRIFVNTVRAKLTGELEPLLAATCTEAEYYNCLAQRDIRVAVDGGAYNGDTLAELHRHHPELMRTFAVEPDRRSFEKLRRYAELAPFEVNAFHGGLWSRTGNGMLAASGNRNSSLFNTSHDAKAEDVALLTVDTLPVGEAVDYIKYDVEGAEREAILGSRRTIERYRPTLAVSLYHRSRDLYELPLLLHRINPEYRFYLRRKYCLPAWELTLYAV